jgi:hypothetical protein
MRVISSIPARASSRCSSVNDAQFYAGHHDLNYHTAANNQRNSNDSKVWRRGHKLFRRKRYAFWRHQFSNYDLHGDRHDETVSARNNRKGRWFSRTNRRNPHHRHHLNHNIAVGLLAVVFCLPVAAEESNNNINSTANPVATGSVSNQAVQINQGGYSQQSFGSGHSCNSATLVFTPFYIGNDVNPKDYTRSQSFGSQISLSIPLNRDMVGLCKELARKRIEKERLDYALVRVLKCAELHSKGYKIREDSPYSVLCADVVPVAAVLPTSQPFSRATSAPEQRQP